jgi:hypothetical protein
MTIEIDGVNNTLKTDKIEPQSGTALQVGASGDTVTLPSGATLNIAGTITNSGTATGFGALDWQTSDVKTSTFTAVAGKGYLVNTTGGAITVNLPAGSAGTQIGLVDYAGTWDSNACTIAPDGSEKIEGATQDVALSNERESVTILYQDSTQGWIAISNSDGKIVNPTYIAASGGTETTSGDYKIHTFTSSGTFTVSSVGNSAGGGDGVSYAVIAGGGGGGTNSPNPSSTGGGGGGAGGFREGKNTGDPYTASPLNAPSGLTVTAQGYPVTIGAGGAGTNPAASGSNSVFSTITSAGGGRGASYAQGYDSENGGSGGGGAYARGGGTGNTPPVSPPQGNNGVQGGQAAPSSRAGGGGGGAGAAGGADAPGRGGNGGNGSPSEISGSAVTRSGGGGGGGSNCNSQPSGGTGGPGNGGNGGAQPGSNGQNGGANSGGGAGGGGGSGPSIGGTGGSGVVIIRYKYQN